MRILFIHHGEVWGGAPKSLRLLQENLPVNIEYSTIVFFPEAKSFFKGDIKVIKMAPCLNLGRHIIGYLKLNSLSDLLKNYLDLRRLIGLMKIITYVINYRPNIVHLNSSILCFLAPVLRILGVKVVLHIREHPNFINRKVARNIFERCLKCCDVKIAIFDSEVYDFDTDNIVTIYNPILREKNISTNNSDLEYDICSLGGYSEWKESFNLLKFFEKNPNRKLLLVGCKKENLSVYERKCYQLAESLKNVTTVGVVTDVNPYFTAAKLHFFGSKKPHFGRPIIEAAYLARRSVCRRNRYNEILSKKYNCCILFDDYKNLEVIIDKHIGDDFQQSPIMTDDFDLAKNVKKIVKVYKEVMNEKVPN
jgi:hypothetical protein